VKVIACDSNIIVDMNLDRSEPCVVAEHVAGKRIDVTHLKKASSAFPIIGFGLLSF
jgi:hypothetical protein